MADSEIQLLVQSLWASQHLIQIDGWEHSSDARENWQGAWEELNKFFAPLEIWRMVTEFGRGEAL